MTVKSQPGVVSEKTLMAVESSESGSSLSSGDENVERGNWVGRLDFIMSCISYAVGLGNIWRFPYLCYRNGGAVFLIPYLTFLFLCGMPLFFIEVSYGQFASLSPITVWRMSPLFKGVGVGMVMISAIVCIYYNIIITWTLYYLFRSFAKTLPWATCDNSWNTPACALRSPGNVTNSTFITTTLSYENVTELQKRTPSEEFWENHVLEISDGIDNMGGIRWELFGCLLLAWALVFICLIRGIKSSGRIVYFTATFPYLVLIILLIRGVTLPGSLEGIKYYIVPDWETVKTKLGSLTVWGEAAMQIFYSIGAAWGALVTYASYNKFNHDCYKDARIVPILNCGTSIFAGFVIFSIIGFMSHETGVPIDKVITQGPGLVFVVYPEAIAKFPVSQIWSIMFFLMLLSVGIGSQFAMFQTVTSAFVDEIDWLKNKKLLFTAALCIIECLLGIPCVTRGGIYYLQIMDWYSSTFSLMILSLTELLVIGWIYGVNRFYSDIELMIGYRPCNWWKACWCVITPLLIVFILAFSIISHKPVTYGNYVYPGWAVGVGWIFALCSIVPLPGVAIYMFVQAKGPLTPVLPRLRKLVRPTPEWGPALDKYRKQWQAKNMGNYGGELTQRLNADPEKAGFEEVDLNQAV